MGCTPARSVTLMVVAVAARLVLVDMGVKGGWRLIEGVAAGVPFSLHIVRMHTHTHVARRPTQMLAGHRWAVPL
jgi:hypothetical protein